MTRTILWMTGKFIICQKPLSVNSSHDTATWMNILPQQLLLDMHEDVIVPLERGPKNKWGRQPIVAIMSKWCG